MLSGASIAFPGTPERLTSLSGRLSQLYYFNDALYFRSETAASPASPLPRKELWRITHSAVTRGGTIGPDYAKRFIDFKDKIYFSGAAGPSFVDSELYSYEPSTNTSTLVANLDAAGSSSPGDFTVLGDKLYFIGVNTLSATSTSPISFERRLYQYDGNVAPSIVNQQLDISVGTNIAIESDQLYFSADDGVHGRELWTLNPAGNSALVKDLAPGTASSAVHNIMAFNGSIYFNASDGSDALAIQLWRVHVSDVAKISNNAYERVAGETSLFFRVSGNNNSGVSRYDGNTVTGQFGVLVNMMATVGDDLYLTCHDQVCRWRFDGHRAEVVFAPVEHLQALGANLFFVRATSREKELFSFDGT